MVKMKRVWQFGAVSLASMVLLAGCSSKSNKEGQATASTGAIGLSVKSGVYVVPDGKKASDSKKYLALNIKIDNKTKKALSVSSYDMSLYDKDGNKMADTSVYDDDNGFQELESGNISGGKSTTGYVVFNVQKGQEYELHYKGNDGEEKQKDVKVKIDADKYPDHTKQMTKLAKEYVDQVFLGAKADDKAALTNDLQKEHDDFKTAFAERLGKQFDNYKPSTAELQKVVTSFNQINAKKATVEYSVAEMLPKAAIIYVKSEVINFDDVDFEAIIDDFTDKNEDKYDDYEKATQDAEKYLLQQLPTKFESAKVSTPEYMDGEGYKVKLVKEKGKWTIDSEDSSDNYDFGELQTAFMGGLDD